MAKSSYPPLAHSYSLGIKLSLHSARPSLIAMTSQWSLSFAWSLPKFLFLLGRLSSFFRCDFHSSPRPCGDGIPFFWYLLFHVGKSFSEILFIISEPTLHQEDPIKLVGHHVELLFSVRETSWFWGDLTPKFLLLPSLPLLSVRLPLFAMTLYQGLLPPPSSLIPSVIHFWVAETS